MERAAPACSGEAEGDRDGEAVQQGADLDGAFGGVAGAEAADGGALLDQGDQVGLPGALDLQLSLPQLLAGGGAAPHLDPEDPARVPGALRQVQRGVLVQPPPDVAGAVGEHLPAAGAELLLAPAEGLQQQLVLAAEVVEQVARTHLELLAEAGHGEAGQPVLGDRGAGGGEDLLARAGRSARAGVGHRCCSSGVQGAFTIPTVPGGPRSGSPAGSTYRSSGYVPVGVFPIGGGGPMVALVLLFAGLAALVAGLAVFLHRRRGGPTENLDGLLAEQERLAQLRALRSSYSSIAMHSTHGLTTDDLGRYHR